ncbi:hypothetical protein VOLCADRAFT_120271 [Volvox carteri f. nagariensis]|uniref:C2 NT-type domain-containing protein n=1 Tax=Volvox carteri f. nagariensis TaxID=3068 RepID=D8TIW7_VOLCA|nr:uncharacterized protein VOLCADRAFT_120271 [Volvox carteri f. nagariensis]EFJ52269.1 hypothetical protein VOLCADRAFT_120271 [Volvox carteri f. nagariensis]|eukprot:XP_002946342.1 hypothetical protein VOLCADRAFT_120271 [Volvox carteri f. nagariensis]
MTKTIGRRFVDIGQKARGRMALRYELEVIPYLCGDLPDGVTHCSFAWERGSKVFVTEAEAVNPNTHAVFWKQYLRQTATMYKEHTELLPKDYAFKVQSVKPGSKPSEEKRKTVGKVHVNLAQFCSEALDAQPQEVLLHLKPCGKLKVSIKATWLRNSAVDSDALTEVTGASLYADSQQGEDHEEQQEGEQDLSGFDPETGEPLPHAHRSRRGGGGGAASTSGGGGGVEEYDEYGDPIPVRKSKKHRRRRRNRTPGEDGIPEDTESVYAGQGGEEGAQEYGDRGGGGGGEEGGEQDGDNRWGGEGEGGRRRGKAGSRASKGEGRPRLQVYGARPNGSDSGAGGLVSSGGLQIEAGRQIHKAGWRDYLCCCLPRRGLSEDPLEGDSLLTRGAVQTAGRGAKSSGMKGYNTTSICSSREYCTA